MHRRRSQSPSQPKPITILYYTILYYTILYYTILYYTASSGEDFKQEAALRGVEIYRGHRAHGLGGLGERKRSVTTFMSPSIVHSNA